MYLFLLMYLRISSIFCTAGNCLRRYGLRRWRGMRSICTGMPGMDMRSPRRKALAGGRPGGGEEDFYHGGGALVALMVFKYNMLQWKRVAVTYLI